MLVEFHNFYVSGFNQINFMLLN